MLPSSGDETRPVGERTFAQHPRIGRDHLDAIQSAPGGTHHRATVAPDCETPSLAVVELVSAVAGADPTLVDPIYEAVDPDALDALCAPGDPSDANLRVTFAYDAYDVTVHGDGAIELVPSTADG